MSIAITLCITFAMIAMFHASLKEKNTDTKSVVWRAGSLAVCLGLSLTAIVIAIQS